MPSDVAIIIVTHNSAHIVARSLAGLPSDHAVIVVDNASSDGTVEQVEAVCSGRGLVCDIIVNADNCGYGAALNQGLRHIEANLEIRYALMMNPDAVIGGEAIRQLREALESCRLAVMAAPFLRSGRRSVSYKLVETPLFHRDSPLIGMKWRRKYRRITDLERVYRCGFLGGAVLMYDLRKMPQLMYFDEDIFLYYEESELQARLCAGGYDLLLVAAAHAEHDGGNSSHFAKPEAWLHRRYYHAGYSRGVLAAKYATQVPTLHCKAFMARSCLLAFLCKLFCLRRQALKYSFRLRGFRDGYNKFRLAD